MATGWGRLSPDIGRAPVAPTLFPQRGSEPTEYNSALKCDMAAGEISRYPSLAIPSREEYDARLMHKGLSESFTREMELIKLLIWSELWFMNDP